ncbi:trypsin-like serine protease, partial [Streptomyces zaomyceticus]|uniref:trypsin-like serine protease n=1 Tax=Streptomyces zaomyceticus TaxID=68286 RepID=UPI00379AFC0E
MHSRATRMAIATMAAAALTAPMSGTAIAADPTPADLPFAFESGSYPNAAQILAEKGIKLLRGDGNITLADCDPAAEQIRVMAVADESVNRQGTYCFDSHAPNGVLTLKLDRVFAIDAGDQPLSAELTAADGTSRTVSLAKDGYASVGEGQAGGQRSSMIEIRTTGPDAAPVAQSGDMSLAFTAKLAIGNSELAMRGCSGALVSPRWVLTASSCFTQGGADLGTGKPSEKTVVTVGRNNLASSGGLVTEVTELVPYQGRDLVLARLQKPAFGITPVPLATTAATAGETLEVTGFGQTKAQWMPTKLHSSTFKVDAVQSGAVAVTGQSGAAVCAGDAGGPLLRQKDGKTELVGINSKSWQGGCMGSPTEARTSAQSVNAADASARTWLKAEREFVHMADATGDGLADIVIQNLNGDVTVRRAYKGPMAFQPGQPRYMFAEGVRWSSGWANFTGQEGKGRLYFADVNADNKADMIVHAADGSVAVRPNLGSGFGSSDAWSSGWANFLGHAGQGRLYFADVNADNKADMIVHAADGSVAVRPNL